MLQRIVLPASLLLLSHTAFAATTPTVESMQETLSKSIPQIKVERVQSTPIEGIYEVTSGSTIFYVTQTGDYILHGDLLSLENNKITNLTDISRSTIVKKELAKLNPDSMIIFPATTDKVKATITIGTDIDCGYCRKLHEEVPALNAAGITVRYLAFPRSPAGTPSYEKSAKVWCEKDRKAALDNALKGGEVTGNPDCENPLPQHLAFVRSIGANATPVTILENGQVVPGYMPAAEMIKLAENATTPSK